MNTTHDQRDTQEDVLPPLLKEASEEELVEICEAHYYEIRDDRKYRISRSKREYALRIAEMLLHTAMIADEHEDPSRLMRMTIDEAREIDPVRFAQELRDLEIKEIDIRKMLHNGINSRELVKKLPARVYRDYGVAEVAIIKLSDSYGLKDEVTTTVPTSTVIPQVLVKPEVTLREMQPHENPFAYMDYMMNRLENTDIDDTERKRIFKRYLAGGPSV